jgi:hypothetical protein
VCGGGAGEEGGRRVDGEGAGLSISAACDGEHGGVVDGVAEDGAGCGDAGAVKGGDFELVGGDGEERVGDDAAWVDGYLCGEDFFGGDVEAADALFDDPVRGGTDGPDLGAGGLEVVDEGEEFGEDVGFDVGGEELGRGGAEVLLGEAGVDLDHLAADG